MQTIARDKRHRDCQRALETIAAYGWGRPTILIESSSEELKAFATTLRALVLASQGQQPAIEGEVVSPLPEQAAVEKLLLTGAGAIATSPLIGAEPEANP